MSWHRHPHVRSGDELTLGERAADRMRNVMGSWPFIFVFVGSMLAWAGVNTVLIQQVAHGRPFDPYPYILLNLLLSTLAGLQGGILLIAAKRADQISSELARHDYEVNVASLEYHVAVSEGLVGLMGHMGYEVDERLRAALLRPSPVPLPPVQSEPGIGGVV